MYGLNEAHQIKAKGSYQNAIRWARNLLSNPLPFIVTSLFY